MSKSKIAEFADKIFWSFLFVLIWGIVGGFALAFTILFTRYGFIWSLLVSGFFSLFHLSDLKRFYLEKNWLAFFGRIFCLYVLSSFIAGFVAFAGGLITIKVDQFDTFVIIFSIIISYCSIIFWSILVKFFSHTRFYQNIRKTIDGLHVLGILWL